MLLNCLPFPIAGGRGRGRATVLLSDVPSASGDVASQTAYSESSEAQVEVDSRDLDVDSRDEEGVSRAEETMTGEQESGPSRASTKKPRLRGETEVPKEEPADEARTLIEPGAVE